jgi:hypothetical protein
VQGPGGQEGDFVDIPRRSEADLLLLYPGESLQNQIRSWFRRSPGVRWTMSFARPLPEVRKSLLHACAAVLDATCDPFLAADAYLQATSRLGSDAVAVYSDKAHEDLELFVRLHRSLFLLGPLSAEQWTEFFERFPTGIGSRREILSNHYRQRNIAGFLPAQPRR